jgi:hypothetical protein
MNNKRKMKKKENLEKKKIPVKWLHLRKSLFSHCPTTSGTEEQNLH